MEILATLIGVLATGLIGVIGALFTGKIVSGSKLAKVEKESQVWKQAHDTLKVAYDTQSALLAQQKLTAEVTDKVMAAVHAQLSAKGMIV